MVYKIRAKWYQLGVQLNICVGTLDSIKHSQNDDECLLKLLTEWLRTNKEPTWEKLAEVLQCEAIGEANLAMKIVKEKCHQSGTIKKYLAVMCIALAHSVVSKITLLNKNLQVMDGQKGQGVDFSEALRTLAYGKDMDILNPYTYP